MPPSSITTSPACSLPPPYPSLPLHSSRFPRRLDRDPAFPAARPLARPPPLLLRAGNMYKYYLEIGTWFQFYAKITFSIVHSFRVGSVTRDGIALDRNKKQNRVRCCAKREEESESGAVKEKSVSVVLLAGGTGKRMGASMPKQYLPLLGQPIALYSFYIFSQMSEVKEIVVVCDPSYKDIFEDASENIQVDLKFALPGKERQDSVFNGFQEIDGSSELVCIHDSARPLVRCEDIKKVLKDAWLNGAAVLGVPVKATIKEAGSDSFVVKTLDRKTLWEMQTPQVIKPNLLRDGFELVNKKGLEVTDDVSIVEHLKHPVYITEGSYTNIKVTTPDDLLLAERVLNMSVGVPS